jgi:predicted transcriptional regulator
MRDRILRVGIAPLELIQQRTIDIASGRRRRLPDEPRIWFTSLTSLAQVLSEPNRALLEIIRSERPATLTELAQRSGRQKSNLSRTLKAMEGFGLVRLERRGRVLAPVVDYDRLDIEVPLAA